MTALRLFTERGFFNTSIHDIQKEAGISIGSIYHYFKNKENIALELYNGLLAAMDLGLKEIEESRSTSHDRCLASIGWLMELTETAPSVMQFIIYARHREFLPGEKPICSSLPFQRMKDMVKQGIDSSEIRSMDLTVASAAVFGGAIRLIQLALDGVLEKPLKSYLDDIWACAWRSVSADTAIL